MTRDEAKNLRPGYKVQVNNIEVGPGRVFTIGDIVCQGGRIYLTDEDFSFSLECDTQEIVKV